MNANKALLEYITATAEVAYKYIAESDQAEGVWQDAVEEGAVDSELGPVYPEAPEWPRPEWLSEKIHEQFVSVLFDFEAEQYERDACR